MSTNQFDVLIVGAGPAGAAAALMLKASGLRTAVLEKAVFPRDKICGDALSIDVINQLQKISPDLSSAFEQTQTKTDCHGVRLMAPNNDHIDIPFQHAGEKKCGYTCTRKVFDNILIEQVKKLEGVKVFEDCEVHEITLSKDDVTVSSNKGMFQGKLIIGADGAHSVVGRKFMSHQIDLNHYCAGLREYYENVKGFHSDHYVELYFFKETLPGYLWVFPLPDNHANVGIGMLSAAVSSRKINLQKLLHQLLTTHPKLKHRFEHAKSLEKVKGFGLPLGSRKRSLSGDRFLLTGDAASLIDPFTGEGIANALRSGRVAAQHAINCFEANDFSATFNAAYDKVIYSLMENEFRISRSMQRLCRYPWLINTIVRKANQNKFIHKTLVDALAQVESKKWLLRPSFYYHLFFGKAR